MMFYRHVESTTEVCSDCRSKDLREFGVHGSRILPGEEPVRPEDYTELGSAPWAGHVHGERYMQCDGCQGQWGPDA